MVLEESHTPYEMQEVDIMSGEQNQSDYLAKHPFGKVPTLEVDGQFLYETSAIVEYLDTTVNNRGLTPQEPMMQARMRQIMAIVDSYLYGPAISTITIQRMIVPQQGGQTDTAAVQAAVPKAKTALEALACGTPVVTLDHPQNAARDLVTDGVTGAVCGVAETGTLILTSGPDSPTTLNLLPDTHIVVLSTDSIVGSYEDGWDLLRARGELPRTVNMITGPSRTGDIEQTIQLGAHGPRRLHILLVDEAAS